MKTKKTAAILLSAVLMLAMLSGCMHVEEKIRFNSDGTVLGGAGIYYSESFFKLIETTPEDYYHAIFADGGMKEEEYPQIISKKIGDETYYGIYEEDLLDVTQAMESSDLSGDTNPIFA